MVIWSILTLEAWEALRRTGHLRAARCHAEKEYLGPYEWMAEQMVRRLAASRPSRNAMPIWAWYQWEGVSRRKPDLRAGGYSSKGEKGVRLEFQVAKERVLLSDFDLWHYVLNYWYLPESEEDGEAFERKLARVGLSFYKCGHERPLPHARYRQEIEKSWERIFDVNWMDQQQEIAHPPEKKSIQATLWELLLADVVKAKEFVAR